MFLIMFNPSFSRPSRGVRARTEVVEKVLDGLISKYNEGKPVEEQVASGRSLKKLLKGSAR